ncbi:tyrosine-type recombinase/integrase [Streptomyces canus]|uniref:tyrosine-type recombinase/integrase n=2 Tax=Streptomyces canus TaxID=58343 RepID=UPI002E255EC8|nr:tyrosine-type recombinase/integrase [Streptomyces canus]
MAAGDRAACTGRDFARSVLRIRRQVQLLGGQLYFTLPKGGKTRVVDMPPSVAAALAQYFMEYPAVEVELPWGGPEPDRETKKFPLVITTTYGNALRANIFNVEVWKPALAAAGVIPLRKKGERWKASRKDGFHVLRHTYASVILEAGESVVTLARWLGHSSPTITLDYYAHFMPEAGRQGARGHRCPAQPLRRRCHGRLDVQFAQPAKRMGTATCCAHPFWCSASEAHYSPC